MVILPKYGGFSVKELANVLSLQHASKVTQSMDPWLVKAAALWRADPARTMLMILNAASADDEMPDEEIESRTAMLNGGRAI